ncbi:dTMP kinase (plasmid) [Paenibacillus sp. S-38]|uniref:dTMP kinase n=1 Tax=Paenibacillus sp. S-38 TaxID=3416710 RepID=UPI003CF21E00
MKIIAFEGLDASGKATQTAMLVQKLKDQGHLTATIAFPRYDQPIGTLIRQWLQGEVSLTTEAAHMLYEADRQDFMCWIDRYEQTGIDYLVIDRYTLSNLAFGTARDVNLDWLQGLQNKIRQPDITFVLDVSPKTSFKRRPERQDKNEKDFSLLLRSRMAYRSLAKTLPYDSDQLIFMLDANGSPEAIHEAVMTFIDNGFV